MSTSKALSNWPTSSILKAAEVRRELQNTWDQVSAIRARAEGLNIEGLDHFPPTPRSFRTDDVSQAELYRFGHSLLKPATGSYATHWTQITGVQRRPQKALLLSLPAEIISHILSYIIGGKVLHVDDAETVTKEHAEVCIHNPAICEIGHGRGPQFILSICVAPMSEQTAWEQFRSGYKEALDYDDIKSYVEDELDRHEICRDWESSTIDCTDKSYVFEYARRFSVFRVCSQLSVAAFSIFWATNTFSFASSKSFKKLLSNLNDTQKEAIKNVDLNFDAAPRRTDFDPCQLMKIQTLDTLNLCLHSSLIVPLSETEEEWPEASQIDMRKAPVNAILRLEILDIRHLNVIIYHDESDFFIDEEHDPSDQRLTMGEKNTLPI
ncbi:MAG: hypothetical protein Q9216_003066 [Gyalolechia sp. 2 TL-2023]